MVQIILIVDGEPVPRDLLSHSLQNRLGYRIVTAVSTREAAQYFHPDSRIRPDLTLFDWPGLAGPETISGIKLLAVHAPLVVLVKYGDYEAASAALNAGAQDFLTKPVAMERISTTFRNLLLLRDARLEVERLRRERMQATGAADAYSPSVPPHSALPPVALVGDDGNIRRMGEIEAETIRFAMQYYHGRMTEVARRLGIGRSTLYRKLGELTAHHEEAA